MTNLIKSLVIASALATSLAACTTPKAASDGKPPDGPVKDSAALPKDGAPPPTEVDHTAPAATPPPAATPAPKA